MLRLLVVSDKPLLYFIKSFTAVDPDNLASSHDTWTRSDLLSFHANWFCTSALQLYSQAVTSHCHTALTLLCLLKETCKQARCYWCPHKSILPLLKGFPFWIAREYSKVKNCDKWLYFILFCFVLTASFIFFKKLVFSCMVRSSTWKQM